MTLADSQNYINSVFNDYLKYADISPQTLLDKRILEIGPGDNLGVALKFLAAGAKQVVCLDKFSPKRNLRQEHKIYQALREKLQDYERENFDRAVKLENDSIELNPKKLLYTCGIGIEEARKIFEPESFDFIISRAVLEHLYDSDAALYTMDKLLIRGGYIMIGTP
jgi:2-polyprenyl-3-methyl-5-hydroxy-6-metoxy-1,4-benzoquinol methylase